MDFIGGDISVRMISSEMVSIEGLIEKTVNNISTIFTFKRFFRLANMFKNSSLMAEITKDGVLVLRISENLHKSLTERYQPHVRHLIDFDLKSRYS